MTVTAFASTAVAAWPWNVAVCPGHDGESPERCCHAAATIAGTEWLSGGSCSTQYYNREYHWCMFNSLHKYCSWVFPRSSTEGLGHHCSTGATEKPLSLPMHGLICISIQDNVRLQPCFCSQDSFSKQTFFLWIFFWKLVSFLILIYAILSGILSLFIILFFTFNEKIWLHRQQCLSFQVNFMCDYSWLPLMFKV